MYGYRLLKKAVALLLCCAALISLPAQINAAPLASTPLSSTVVADPSVLLDVLTQNTQKGHLVSRVYRYAGRGTPIGSLENNTLITVLGENGEFYRINCYEMEGYIPKSQVRCDENGQYYVSCDPNSRDSNYLPTRSTQAASTIRGTARQIALSLQGVPYVRGGTTPRGFDCSGFTMYVLRQVGLDIHRNLMIQLADGIIIPKSDLQCGDLVFFSNTTGWGHFASHLGIYIGDGKLIHAGSNGITVVDLNSSYFTYYYQCSRRVILSDMNPDITGGLQKAPSSYWR